MSEHTIEYVRVPEGRLATVVDKDEVIHVPEFDVSSTKPNEEVINMMIANCLEKGIKFEKTLVLYRGPSFENSHTLGVCYGSKYLKLSGLNRNYKRTN